MLEVQKYLREKSAQETAADPVVNAIGWLNMDFAIRATFSPTNDLVILNYDQIDSPKRHPITQECRGLTLEVGSWDVVARAFTRFFNAGECPDIERKFDWSSFGAESKEDGSLAMLYRYKGSWRVNTRGSFALGEIGCGIGKTWEEVFYEGIDEVAMDTELRDGFTYVFELCSPYNKVVRRYDKVTLFLLTAFHNATGVEVSEVILDRLAGALRVQRPDRYDFVSIGQVRDYLESQDDPTFEGVVLRDRHGMRLKVKNSRYVALHHLHDNGNLFNPKRLLPLVLKGEQGEVLTHFAELTSAVFDMVEQLGGAKARLLAVWEAARGIKSQKEFALFVTKHTQLASILFEARKRQVEPDEVWRESGDLLLRRLYQKSA